MDGPLLYVTYSILRSQNISDSARFHWMIFKFCCSNVSFKKKDSNCFNKSR